MGNAFVHLLSYQRQAGSLLNTAEYMMQSLFSVIQSLSWEREQKADVEAAIYEWGQAVQALLADLELHRQTVPCQAAGRIETIGEELLMPIATYNYAALQSMYRLKVSNPAAAFNWKEQQDEREISSAAAVCEAALHEESSADLFAHVSLGPEPEYSIIQKRLNKLLS